jgi:hypothetical protein
MSRRIKYYEFEKANKKLWLNCGGFLNDEHKLSVEDCERYHNICRLYRKQNRFNIFSIFDRMYKDFLPYGKKCLFVSKLQLTILLSLILWMALIPFYKFFAFFVLCMLPPLLVVIILQQNWDSKYKESERDWEYEKKYNPNFERQQKLKRILSDGC